MTQLVVPEQENGGSLKILERQASHIVTASRKLRDTFFDDVLHACDGKKFIVHHWRSRQSLEPHEHAPDRRKKQNPYERVKPNRPSRIIPKLHRLPQIACCYSRCDSAHTALVLRR